MKVGELKYILDKVDDDFEINIFHAEKVSEEELNKRSWKYPYDNIYYDIDEHYDIGYSEKTLKLEIFKIDE